MDASKAERVLREIEGSSGGRWIPIIGRRRGQILVEHIRLHRPRRILEVGTFVGYSTILMAKELPAGTEVIGIEIDEDEAEQARANIEAAELEADVTVETGDALEIIPGLEGEFDMVFLDADKWEYYNYLNNMARAGTIEGTGMHLLRLPEEGMRVGRYLPRRLHARAIRAQDVNLFS